jgi:hypothetical protein
VPTRTPARCSPAPLMASQRTSRASFSLLVLLELDPGVGQPVAGRELPQACRIARVARAHYSQADAGPHPPRTPRRRSRRLSPPHLRGRLWSRRRCCAAAPSKRTCGYRPYSAGRGSAPQAVLYIEPRRTISSMPAKRSLRIRRSIHLNVSKRCSPKLGPSTNSESPTS